MAEATLFEHLGQPRFSRLGAQSLPDLLGERRGHADHGRSIVVESADGIADIGRWMVGRNRLDDHPRAARLQQLAYMLCAAARIAHVVQTVEHGDEIEVAVGDAFGRGRHETYAIRETMRLHMRVGLLDRGRVKIVTDERT
jgi:hypothetical protein